MPKKWSEKYTEQERTIKNSQKAHVVQVDDLRHNGQKKIENEREKKNSVGKENAEKKLLEIQWYGCGVVRKRQDNESVAGQGGGEVAEQEWQQNPNRNHFAIIILVWFEPL